MLIGYINEIAELTGTFGLPEIPPPPEPVECDYYYYIYGCDKTLMEDMTEKKGITGLSVNGTYYAFTQKLSFDGSHYIDSGVVPTVETVVEIDHQMNDTANAWVFGSRKASNQNAFSLNVNMARTAYYPRIGSNSNYSFTVANERHQIVMSKSGINVDGELKKEFSGVTITTDLNLYIGALNQAGTVTGAANTDIYTMKIYDSGNLLRYYVPCISDENSRGLFDLVNYVFYPLLSL